MTTNLTVETDSLSGLHPQSEGQILAVGIAPLFGDDDRDIALVRYETDGSLDLSFGDNGVARPEIEGDQFVQDAALQSGNRLVVAGVMIGETGFEQSRFKVG